MNVHFLAGDSLREQLSKTEIEGEVLVCRECFVDGPVDQDSLEDLWAARAEFLFPNSDGEQDGEDDYRAKTVDQFIRLWELSEGNSVNLWFERELFCQVNLWFTLWLIRNTNATIFVVYPPFDAEDQKFAGFSEFSAAELQSAFDNRLKLSHDDVFLGTRLWEAFKKRDFSDVGETQSEAFPTIDEIIEEATSVDTRPRKLISDLIDEGFTEFGSLFKEFLKRYPVYGFGDLQVKRIFDELNA